MRKQYYIYVHCRPSGKPFYVGYSGRKVRGYDLNSKIRENKYHANVVAKYGKENILIHIRNCDSENQAKVHEVWMIAWCFAQGFRMTNMTKGGEGVSGLKMPVRSPEFRAKLANIQKNVQKRKISDEDDILVSNLYQDGFTIYEIAAIWDVCHTTIIKSLKRTKIPRRHRHVSWNKDLKLGKQSTRTKAKRSKALKRYWADPIKREKMLAARK
jgi:hypothetical protein